MSLCSSNTNELCESVHMHSYSLRLLRQRRLEGGGIIDKPSIYTCNLHSYWTTLTDDIHSNLRKRYLGTCLYGQWC